MEILLANPRGFCAGVDRAISIVERALEIFQPPIYVRHEVVHNKFVVNGLKDRGAVFVDELSEVPDDSIVIFSAHGVSQAVRKEANSRGLKVFDATCPLVTKVHMEVTRASKKGIECVLIGHQGHPEVEGTMGQYNNPEGGIYLVESPDDVKTLNVKNPSALYYCSQTTLSVDDTADVIDALRAKYPEIKGPRKDDICYATQNRQDAVRDLANKVDLMLVVGAANSSNSNRLRELSEKVGTKAYLIDDASNIDTAWLASKPNVGVTAGASAPDVLVKGVIDRLKELGASTVIENPGKEENIVFAVPAELQEAPKKKCL
ncbi:4-hydroxy-3-methylbut-2-enyl diphosphate reductase [Psychrosphaera saromensis]|uniref:4-hydroxy-3-methylbut-2-enyl diphosphate reductase n=1 Tax=Psychrosphaera saromensis TaxID=716813 RepID=A0A2S7UYD5_9GAMM|nr:4-hydroxy-3-methylbut-2-enyl diphosphate reductase [Psychrosphaera saromensis]PQJ55004.1 4-hydroxy-3-methylbut-2-enyl diphosphate reductase [Psychrosphaera saromensis]GHB55427.1 4-hydroxy-3-methylbut-2-enyl diphosphate reductase [Psychrosphaera saromensis]GLQ13738.1 4-hydroxy-3-methylbut-2-enyl diphosphate reductase [Psychrosphaera saromensis]